MEVKIEKEKKYKVTKGNMVRSHKIKGSMEYKRAKLMCIMSMKDRMYYNLPFRTHIEDIEQTLIDYGIKDERLYTALWVANCDIPFKQRIKLFGRDIVKIAFGFCRGNLPRHINSITNKQKLMQNDDVITLHLAQRIANINFAINNTDNVSFGLYVDAYSDYEKALKRDVSQHEQMWEYLKFTCVDAGSINNLFFYV